MASALGGPRESRRGEHDVAPALGGLDDGSDRLRRDREGSGSRRETARSGEGSEPGLKRVRNERRMTPPRRVLQAHVPLGADAEAGDLARDEARRQQFHDKPCPMSPGSRAECGESPAGRQRLGSSGGDGDVRNGGAEPVGRLSEER